MITQKIANVTEEPCDAIVHQANCFVTMNSGVARAIKDKYPEAFVADFRTKSGDKSKLGTFSWAKTGDNKIIYNMYSQFDFGYQGNKFTDYDAIKKGLTSVKSHLTSMKGQNATLALPYLMGCDRGGGDWNVVRQIIEDIFSDKDGINVVICQLNQSNHRDIPRDQNRANIPCTD